LRLKHDGEAPLAVVLTPGSFKETYFEHAYLRGSSGFRWWKQRFDRARDTAYLKTLRGFAPGACDFRRLDDDFCDPVELRADSALGVPGLIAVVRAGTGGHRRPSGAAYLESAAWMGFIPAAAERLLGEKLRLPSVATWWCGEQRRSTMLVRTSNAWCEAPHTPIRNSRRFSAVIWIQRRAQPWRAADCEARMPTSRRTPGVLAAPVWRAGGAHGIRGTRRWDPGLRISTPRLSWCRGDSLELHPDAADIVSMQRGGGQQGCLDIGGGPKVDGRQRSRSACAADASHAAESVRAAGTPHPAACENARRSCAT